MAKKECLKWKIAADHFDERWGHCIEWLESWSEPECSDGWWHLGSVWGGDEKAKVFSTKADAEKVLALFAKCGYSMDDFWVQGCLIKE